MTHTTVPHGLVPTPQNTPSIGRQVSEDDELLLLREHGPLLWEALVAFGSEPDYAIDMIRAAEKTENLSRKRAEYEARRRAAGDERPECR
jgi:hypothetical protein